MSHVQPWLALGVFLSTAATDAVYISYIQDWVYVIFAASGSWVGAFASMTLLRRPVGGPQTSSGRT